MGKRCSAGESWTSLAVSVWPGAPRGIRSCLRGSSHAVTDISVAVLPVSHANIPLNREEMGAWVTVPGFHFLFYVSDSEIQFYST